MKPHKLDTFSIIMVSLSALGNIGHLLWTVWLISEQIKTGWGYGTDICSMCSPICLSGIKYLFTQQEELYESQTKHRLNLDG